MIYRLNRFSHFVGIQTLKKLAQGRQPKACKGRWVFVRIAQTAIVTKEKDVLEPFLYVLNIERSELLERLIAELDSKPRLMAVLVNDGLFVHSESFGKAMLRILK